ncbi:regulator of chromosome condensation 1/beta-lactamase-inhibitor protein II [Mycena albidolilacea]|uniref:Regulator of chromosome condensation 1/beta-lactamase-inhibitor protein II n=1 Tax=Mycena albidolilacea TaxID=1033008 RepID=A0AAD6ZQC1_9AGAR|nr:regulator of chromosome condensation 1/beta-lactamase-inhibitor protein II [Mycena albidolilacea]
MSSLEMIPLEVILDNLLMDMPIQSVVRLGCTNKLFANICADELLWHRRLQTDFNFSGAGTARVSGWKIIYRGLFNPKVFVWGEKTNGRLGLGNKFPKCNLANGGVPFPTQLRIPGARIVSIVSGGMSFHALDSEGNIYVWGTLNGQTGSLGSDGFSEPGKPALTPLRLELPTKIKHVSCGRFHASALDFKGQVWNFTSWGRPFTLSSRLLLRDSRPIQVECGWGFSSLLTKSGEVFAWWPQSGSLLERIDAKNASMDEERQFFAKPLPDGVIPCATWDLGADPTRLPGLPSLPELTATGELDEAVDEIKIIKIAALDARLVALTNQGHVVFFSGLGDENTVSTGRWQYLPNFSELDRVRTIPPFTPTDGSPGIDPPQAMKITHISAHFKKFFAYSTGSSSVVLMGDTDTTEETNPHIEPALQNKHVVSMLVGDWHNAALTSSGQLLTWGGYSAGALGLGDPSTLTPGTPGAFATERQRLDAFERGIGNPPNTDVPTEVRFDHARKTPKERFCFLACAAGWQTGALVIDTQADGEDEGSDEEEELMEDTPRRHVRPVRGGHGLPIQHPHPFGFPVGGPFRIGFAGRGATRGRGL